MTANHRTPAVVNISIQGGASDAVDNAVRRSIAAGVTYAIAAGNFDVDSAWTSPGRTAEAITVGATDESDVRAGFSNYGPGLDLFAPGVNVLSAYYSSDSGAVALSGTSMASPHVAGVAALYLAAHPTATPAKVRNALVAAATRDVVASPGAGSPNRPPLLGFLVTAPPTPPSVTVLAPNGGERLTAGTPFTIQWSASDPDGLSRFDVMLSTDGVNYSGVCTSLGRQPPQLHLGLAGAGHDQRAHSRDGVRHARRHGFRRLQCSVHDRCPRPASGRAPVTVDIDRRGQRRHRGNRDARRRAFTVKGSGADIWATSGRIPVRPPQHQGELPG